MSRGGQEYELTSSGYTAVVTEVGGGLRSFTHEGRDLVLPYATGEVRPRFRGSLLAPWPNRVVDGRYEFDGVTYQLDLTEPERGHALHGLVAWERFQLVDRDPSSVTLSHRIVPRTGYPFEVEVEVRYQVDVRGLTCQVRTTNRDGRAAPYGLGSHPYLVAGDGPVDRWSLELTATRVLEVTAERLVPRGLMEVAGGRYDFRSGASLAGVEIDHAFTDLEPDTDGLVRARVLSGDAGVECTWDPVSLPWVQVHTADLPPPHASRAGLALEPMSCPPDAFNSGVDLRVLEPGASTEDRWTLRALPDH